MSNPYVGEIEMYAFNFAPTGWALCQGQLLPIAQNTALFSLLGTYYGGDGRSTFGLPNLQGCVAVGQGQAPGLSPYTIGQKGGTATVSLVANQIGPHTHTLPATNVDGKITTPTSATVLGGAGGGFGKLPEPYVNSSNGNMATGAASVNTGTGQAHNNMAPYVSMNFCIALQGQFPPRN